MLGVAPQHAQQQGHGRAHGADAGVESSMHKNTAPDMCQARVPCQKYKKMRRPHLGSGAATAWACSQLQ